VDSFGNVFVTDMIQNCIRKITPAGTVTTFAGKPGYSGGYADGTGRAARFQRPTGLATDLAGNVYVADLGNRSIRRIASDGTVATLACISGDQDDNGATGKGTTAPGYPFRIALDNTGNLYLADLKYSIIRKGIPAPASSMPLTLAAP